jgi:class 3 adenylate cyclase
MTERSTAIVLFTDLVGSTELRSRLGEDAAEALRHRHDDLVAQGVMGARGTVVKNLGDGMMATFAGATDAVRAAVAIQQAIGRHNLPGVPALEVRIGISAGDVVFEEGDCFGTPVIEAARLCGSAQGGQILASELVRGLAHAAEETFTSIGALELKGLAKPLPTVQVDWHPPPRSTVPLPAFLTEMGRIFVGRDGELDRLGQLWKEAVAGELRVAFLAGEPGIGKTRLAAELARRVHDEGATVLAGRCDEDLGVPYQPFVEALRHFVDNASALSERLGRYGGELARLVPELGERVPNLPAPLRSDPEMERYRLFDAVAAWLTATSSGEPLLLVLDDLQWAAKPTLMLLRHVVTAGSGGRILVLGTYRDTELTHDHPLLEVVPDLRRQGGVERLSLSGLDDGGVAAFVEQASGRALDAANLALARAVYEETEGNPFFVREVLRHLAETGAIERREGSWTPRLPVDQMGIPEGVRDVVGRRLARLSDTTNRVLRVAAVVGPEFELGVVQAAGDVAEETLLGAVEEAAEARVITEASATRFRFAHALVRASLYESLSAARQVALHRRTAEAIEALHDAALDDFIPVLAHHWAKACAPVTDTTRAVEYARRAGDRALALLAHDEAARYYASGIDLLDAGGADANDPRRVDLLIGKGEAQRRALDPAYRDTLLAAARLAKELGDAHALARAALANTLGHMWTGVQQVDADRVEMLEAAIEAVGEEDRPVRARLLATLGLELAWQPDHGRRLDLSAEALRISRALDDPATLAHVLLARDYTITAPENATERLAGTTELLSIADRLGDPVLASRALSLRFKAAMELAAVDEAERSVARNDALVANLGQPMLTWAVKHHQATLSVLRMSAGTDAAVLAASELAPSLKEMYFFAHLHMLRIEQDRAGEVVGFIGQLAERVPTFFMKSIHARVLPEVGRLDAATRLFEEFAATGFAHPAYNASWLHFQCNCAWLCARLDRTDCVDILRPRLEPYADQLVVTGFAAAVPGTVAFYLALLAATVGDWPGAEARFAAATVTYERVRAPFWLARTRLEWARMLQKRGEPGDRQRAGELLRQAQAAARDLGLSRIEQDVSELLRSS